jgi:hypothetical protein
MTRTALLIFLASGLLFLPVAWAQNDADGTSKADMEGARTKAIQAVVAKPYNPVTWRYLEQWANMNYVKFRRVHVNVPKVPEGRGSKTEVRINVQADAIGTAWLYYSLSRLLWRGDKFKQQYPHEEDYRHSLAEETDALRAAVEAWSNATDGNRSARPDSNLALLLKISQADMIECYVLLSAPDEGIVKDYAEYREKNRLKLEQYLSQFVVPQAPPKE